MHAQDVDILERLWPAFFPRDRFHHRDKRLDIVKIFSTFLASNDGVENDCLNSDSATFDVIELSESIPFPDFISTLITQLQEIIGCMVRNQSHTCSMYRFDFLMLGPCTVSSQSSRE